MLMLLRTSFRTTAHLRRFHASQKRHTQAYGLSTHKVLGNLDHYKLFASTMHEHDGICIDNHASSSIQQTSWCRQHVITLLLHPSHGCNAVDAYIQDSGETQGQGSAAGTRQQAGQRDVPD